MVFQIPLRERKEKVWMLRATAPYNYLKKTEKIKKLDFSNAQDYAMKISGEVKDFDGVVKESIPIKKRLEKNGGGFIVYNNFKKKRGAYLLKVKPLK